MSTQGIDVSMHQGSIDFKKVKAAGYSFVIIRCNDWNNGLRKDPYFEQNYKNAKAAGLNVGVYWFTWQSTADGATEDAKTCLEYIKGKKFEYPIFFDLEWNKAFAKGKSVCTKMVENFCGYLEKNGYYAGLYMSRSPLQNYISADTAKKYTLWIAEYASKCNYSESYGIWQYSSKGKVNGITGNVDMDICLVDYPSVIKAKGLNGYTVAKAEKKKLDASGFKRGNNSDGVLALKMLLSLAKSKGLTSISVDDNGIFGDGTEKAVNALLNTWGYAQNGIAGPKFIIMLRDKLK